jgi:hypothetical protein
LKRPCSQARTEKQKRNEGVTEIVKMPHRGHALTIDAGWREVAERVLDFVKRFTARQTEDRVNPQPHSSPRSEFS